MRFLLKRMDVEGDEYRYRELILDDKNRRVHMEYLSTKQIAIQTMRGYNVVKFKNRREFLEYTRDNLNIPIGYNYPHLDQLRYLKKVDNIDFNPYEEGVMSIDIESDGEIILLACCVYQKGDHKETEIFTGEETDLLSKLVEYIEDRKPIILSGHFAKKFDFPTIKNRAEIKSQSLGQRFQTIYNQTVLVDTYEIYATMEEPFLSLAALSKKYFKTPKMKFNVGVFREDWEKYKDLAIEYCKLDTEICHELLIREDILLKNIVKARILQIPYEDCFSLSTYGAIDLLFLRYGWQNGLYLERNKSNYLSMNFPTGVGKEGIFYNVLTVDMSPSISTFFENYRLCIYNQYSEYSGVTNHTVEVYNRINRVLMDKNNLLGRVINREEYPLLRLEKEFFADVKKKFFKYFYTNDYVAEISKANLTHRIRKIFPNFWNKLVTFLMRQTPYTPIHFQDLKIYLYMGGVMPTLEEAKEIIGFMREFGIDSNIYGYYSFVTLWEKNKGKLMKMLSPEEKVEIYGLNISHVNSFEYLRESQSLLIKLLGEGAKENEVRDFLEEQLLRLEENRIPNDELLVRATKRSKGETNSRDYLIEQAINKLERMLGKEIGVGNMFSYVVTGYKNKVTQIEPYFSKIVHNYVPAIEFYKKRWMKGMNQILNLKYPGLKYNV